MNKASSFKDSVLKSMTSGDQINKMMPNEWDKEGDCNAADQFITLRKLKATAGMLISCSKFATRRKELDQSVNACPEDKIVVTSVVLFVSLVQQNKYVIMDPHQPQAVSSRALINDYSPWLLKMLNP